MGLKIITTVATRIAHSSSHEDYYNGVVFSGYIKGLPFRVLSGGRYDALLKRFGRQSGALGFAIYLDELDALSVTQRIDDSKEG